MSAASPPARRRSSMKVFAMLLTFATLLFVGVTGTQTAEAAPSKKPSITWRRSSARSPAPAGGQRLPTRSPSSPWRRATGGQGHLHRQLLGDGDDTVKKAVTVPVSQGPHPRCGAEDVQAQATCQILNLLAGPAGSQPVGSAWFNSTRSISTSLRCRARATCSATCSVPWQVCWTHRRSRRLNDIIADLLNLILGNLND